MQKTIFTEGFPANQTEHYSQIGSCRQLIKEKYLRS